MKNRANNPQPQSISRRLYAILLQFSHEWSNLSFYPPTKHFKTLQVFLIFLPKCPSFSTIKSYASNIALY